MTRSAGSQATSGATVGGDPPAMPCSASRRRTSTTGAGSLAYALTATPPPAVGAWNVQREAAWYLSSVTSPPAAPATPRSVRTAAIPRLATAASPGIDGSSGSPPGPTATAVSRAPVLP